jgi:hypothetical protein
MFEFLPARVSWESPRGYELEKLVVSAVPRELLQSCRIVLTEARDVKVKA